MMLELQYIRGILIVNNLVTFILSFVIGGWWYGLASVLLTSWLQNIATVIYTAVRLRAAKREGYFRVPLNVDEFGVPLGDMAEKPKMSTAVAAINSTMDSMFAITMLAMVPISITTARNQEQNFAAVGAIVALVVHVFFAMLSINIRAVTKYRLKIMIVHKDSKSAAKTPAAAEAVMEEQQASKEGSIEEPEHLSPRPYRGSPSTKPSKPSNLSSDGPIRLIEPTEGDYLIAERE